MTLLDHLRFQWDRVVVRTRLAAGPYCPLIPLVRADMSGKNVLVTGANTGIGLELATKLASMNATVFLACRNAQKAEAAKQQILAGQADAKVEVLTLDQASLASVRQFAADWKAGDIDVLYHNAGISNAPQGNDFTADGFEAVYQTNFLSAFLLTQLLEPHLAPKARVIFTSSSAAYGGDIKPGFALKKTTGEISSYFHTSAAGSAGSQRYFNSKLMQNAFCRALQAHFDRDQSTQRLSLAFEPGVINTQMMAEISSTEQQSDAAWRLTAWLGKNMAIPVEQGAATGVFVAVSRDATVVEDYKGCFFSANYMRLTPSSFYSQQMLDQLWQRWSADADVTWT